MKLTLTTTYMHTRRVWRWHTPVTSQACFFSTHYVPISPTPSVFLLTVSFKLCLLSFLLSCALFSKVLWLFWGAFSHPCPPTHMHTQDVFDFGMATTTFPSTHACSRSSWTYTCCAQTLEQAREQFSLHLGCWSNDKILSSRESFSYLKVKVKIFWKNISANHTSNK